MTKEELDELIENSSEVMYGLPVIEIDDAEYAIALDENDADSACEDYIEGSVWAFNPWFLEQMTDVPVEIFKASEYKCESLNDAILILIRRTCGWENFVNQAIAEDGRGHFLSCYDDKEIELECGYYAYRVN